MPNEPQLSIVALAYREGQHLAKCFASAQRLRALTSAPVLIVLDSEADRATSEIASRVADRLLTRAFDNFSRQRNFALDAVSTRWVFFIDPDERLTAALCDELVRVLASSEHEAYRIPRRNILFGKEVRHTGWSPDYQVRLLRTDRCRYDETQAVHEVPLVEGSTGTLQHPLVHFNYATWGQFIRKQRSYAPLEARALYAAGRRAHLRSLAGQPLREFKRRFFDYRGYKDGPLGFELSVAMSAYKLLTYWHLLQLQGNDG